MTESYVEQQVQQRIAAARIRIAAAKERRASLAEARRYGLARRHAAKLAYFAEQERRQADEQHDQDHDDHRGEPVTERTLTHGETSALTDDIRDHGYAILQTRGERIPKLIKGLTCQEPDGCTRPATLATLAVEEVATNDDDEPFGLYLAKDPDGLPRCIVVCDEHRCEASHDRYRDLTGRQRPDGIRAFDAVGQHLSWH